MRSTYFGVNFTVIFVSQPVSMQNEKLMYNKETVWLREKCGNECRKNNRISPRWLYYKTFYGCNLRIFIISQTVCVSGKPFQPRLMFVGKARGLLQSGALERCFTRVGFGLTSKHQTSSERLARDEHSHSSLL